MTAHINENEERKNSQSTATTSMIYRDDSTGMLVGGAALLVDALGPFSTDSYLPSLPMMVSDLRGGSAALVVMALQLSLLTRLAFSTLPFTSIKNNDKFALKAFLLSGVVFCGTSVAASYCNSIWLLCVFRIIQGAAEGNFVGSSAIAPFLLRPENSFPSSVSALKPLYVVLSPCIGGLISHFLSWRWVFRVQGAWSLVNIIVVCLAYFTSSDRSTEQSHFRDSCSFSQSTNDRAPHPKSSIRSRAGGLLRDRMFVGLCGVTSLFMAQTLGLLYAAPFFIHSYYNISTVKCGLLLGSIPFAGILGSMIFKMFGIRPTESCYQFLTVLWLLISIVFYVEAALDLYTKWYYLFIPIYCSAAVGFSLGPLTRFIISESTSDNSVALDLQNAIQIVVSTSGSLMVSIGEPSDPHRTLYYMFNCTAVGVVWFLVVCGFEHVGRSIAKLNAKQHERAHLLEETTDGGSEIGNSTVGSIPSVVDWSQQALFWPSNSLAGSFGSGVRRDPCEGSPSTPI